MRRFYQSMFLAPAAAVLIAGSAEAQVGGAGGFGTGGSGGGAYVSGGGPGSILRLITYPEVQQDLQLDQQQKGRIGEILGALQALELKVLQARPEAPPDPRPHVAMEERMRRLEKENEKARRQIETVLTSVQRERLKQVSLQNRGAEMLFDPEIVEALGITKAQQNRLEAMRQRVQQKEYQLMKGAHTLPFEKRGEAIQSAIRKITQTQDDVAKRMLDSVLNTRQKAKLKELQGRKLELAPRYVPRSGGATGGSSGGFWRGGGVSGGAAGGRAHAGGSGSSGSFGGGFGGSGGGQAGERLPR